MHKRQDFYYWRIIAAGISFMLFGLGGILLWALVFPAVALLTPAPKQRRKRCRLVVHYSFKLFIGMMSFFGIFRYTVQGQERLNRPRQLVIANHPSLIDVVFLISLIKDTNCIVKGGLFKNYFTRGSLINSGYIPNDSSEAMIANSVKALKTNDSLVIFPEGTRTRMGEVIKFQRGAAYIARQSNAIVTPVTIRCSPPMLTKSQKWYEVAYKRAKYEIIVGQDLPIEAIAQENSESDMYPSMQARKTTRAWQDFFTKEMAV